MRLFYYLQRYNAIKHLTVVSRRMGVSLRQTFRTHIQLMFIAILFSMLTERKEYKFYSQISIFTNQMIPVESKHIFISFMYYYTIITNFYCQSNNITSKYYLKVCSDKNFNIKKHV